MKFVTKMKSSKSFRRFQRFRNKQEYLLQVTVFVGIEVPVGDPEPFAFDPQGAKSHQRAVVVDTFPKFHFFIVFILVYIIPESCPLNFTPGEIIHLESESKWIVLSAGDLAEGKGIPKGLLCSQNASFVLLFAFLNTFLFANILHS